MTTISYQLYCSRNFPPLADTLQMLSSAGYKEVEGYGALFVDPGQMHEAVEAAGLHMSTAHIGIDMLEEEADKVLGLIEQFKMRSVFAPFLPPDQRPHDAAGWSAFGARLAAISKPYTAAGVAFGWHNHEFELIPVETGAMPLDLMLAAAPDLQLELDLGWVARAGQDPVATIEKYAGRIAAVHIKDLAAAGENADEDGWADVGQGVQNWAGIHSVLKAIGVDHYVIEHDNPSDDRRFATRSLAAVQNF